MIARLRQQSWRAWQSVRTWRWEALVAAVLLFGSADLWDPVQVVTALAVFYSFLYVQVANRLDEAEERRTVTVVECRYKLTRYLLIKEALWVAAFVMMGNWPALVGCGLFLGYPLWRKAYVRFRTQEAT